MSGLYVYLPRPVLHPWYEKRRRSSSSREERLACGVLRTIDTSHWLGVGRGLDDFRCGPPPSSAASLQPLRKRRPPTRTTRTSSTNTREICGYFQQHRKSYNTVAPRLEKIEKHNETPPLKVLPLLEKNLPPEVFNQLIKVLQDPNADLQLEVPQKAPTADAATVEPKVDKKDEKHEDNVAQKKSYRKLWVKSASQLMGRKSHSRGTTSKADSSDKSDVTGDLDAGVLNPTIKISSLFDDDKKSQREINPYKSFVKKTFHVEPTLSARTKHTTTTAKPIEKTLSLHEIANDFCKWTQELTKEGEPVNMDPERLITMFAVSTDYSGLVTTVRVLDKMSVPKEVGAGKSDPSLSNHVERVSKVAKPKKPPQKRARSRYGAWYLDVKLWKETVNNEPLLHPDDVKAKKAKDELLRTDSIFLNFNTSKTSKKSSKDHVV